jgi:hypothetical protein
MTEKLYNQIMDFGNSVGEYIRMEYEPIYYKEFKTKNLNMFDFIGSYYMGGSNVPDTARYVVELIKMNNRTEN